MVHQRISREMWKATLTAYAPQIRWFYICVFVYLLMHLCIGVRAGSEQEDRRVIQCPSGSVDKLQH